MYSVRMPNSVESRTISSTSSRVAGLEFALASQRNDAGGTALLANLVDQQADLAARPEPGDKTVARGRLVERQVELEYARRTAIVAPKRELERLIAGILAEHDDLVTLENVGKSSRDQLPGAAMRRVLADREDRIGKHRTLQALEHGGDFHLDVLAGEDERGGRPALVGDLLEQRRVDVDADAEREDSPLVRIALAGQLADHGFRSLPDGRQAVGHEQDDRQRSIGGRLPKGFEQGVVDVGPAPRGHPFEELGGVFDRLRDLRTGRSANGSTPSL